MNNKITRLFAAFAAFMMIFPIICGCSHVRYDTLHVSSAQGNADSVDSMDVMLLSNGDIPATRDVDHRVTTLANADLQGAKAAMITAIDNVEAKCNVSAFGIKAEQAGALFAEIINSTPGFFYLSSRIKFSYNKTTGVISEIAFEYSLDKDRTTTATKDEVLAARAEYTKMVSDIMAQMPSDITADYDIALWYHDHLCLSFAYDTSHEISDVYNFLKYGKGVCQAYSLLYTELLSKYGIPCDYATSPAMSHIWNVIEIGGRWYHVDVTWDDTLPDIRGHADHDSFLCSDSALMRVGHHDWSSPVVCESTLFDFELLDRIDTAFARIAGSWYFADRGGREICQLDLSNATKTAVLPVNETWDEDSCYLGVCAVGGKLCYNTPNSIRYLDLPTGVSFNLYDHTKPDEYIYTIRAKNNSVEFTAGKTPSIAAGNVKTFEPTFPELHRELSGGEEGFHPTVSIAKDAEGAKLDFRIVIACPTEFMKDRANLEFELAFTMGNSLVKSYVYYFVDTADGLYLYGTIVDKKALYSAATGQCLFGIAIDGIPEGDCNGVTVRVRDMRQENIIYESKMAF